MFLLRHFLSCRLKTRFAVIALLVIFISVAVTYRALMSESAKNSQFSSLPTIDRRKSIKLQPKHNNVNILGDKTFHIKKNLVKSLDSQDFLNQLRSLKDRDLLSADSKEALTNFLLRLYPTSWKTTPDTDDVALELKYLLIDYGFESKLSCKDIDNLRLGNAVTYSKTKHVEYAYYDSQDRDIGNYDTNGYQRGQMKHEQIVARSPSQDVKMKIECLKQIYDQDRCQTVVNYRMLREILLLSAMKYPSIITMKGYCLRGDRLSLKLQEKGVIVVTEAGTPFSSSVISTMSWKKRVSIAFQVSQLLLYFDSSPLGSLRFNKLEMQDFILYKNNQIKLADLDDIRPGEQACVKDDECTLKGTNRGVYCVKGLCDGLNMWNNLFHAQNGILRDLLGRSPDGALKMLQEDMEKLSITTSELAARLQELLSKLPEDSLDLSAEARINNGYQDVGGMSREEDNSVREHFKREESDHNSDLPQFERQNFRNFVGMYDYPCPGSRVTWGCVTTVTSLEAAAKLCLLDPECRCFVTFSTRPEEENLMTISLKNGTDAYPQTSSGTTLFIRKSTKYDIILRESMGKDFADTEGGVKESAHNEVPSVKKVELREKLQEEIDDCVVRTLQVQDAARQSRERRLMAHMGLKGTKEQIWRRFVLEQVIENHNRIVRLEGGGGKFLVNFTEKSHLDVGDEASKMIAKKGTFIAEDGPKAYHTAYAIVYHIDRILGLYNTPPCIGQELRSSVVDKFLTNPVWEDAFKPLIQSDGTLPGIVVVPTPKVMKLSKLTLLPLKSMVKEVELFNRPDKLQLEYVLLWWLGRMEKHDRDHLGYKGHLIHFAADKAFTNTSIDLTGYLYHCQFPNVAYKALNCFRCLSSDDSGTSKICSFGAEVVERAHSMFKDDADFFIHGLSEPAIKASIDTAASDILRVVDKCIRVHGREHVIY